MPEPQDLNVLDAPPQVALDQARALFALAKATLNEDAARAADLARQAADLAELHSDPALASEALGEAAWALCLAGEAGRSLEAGRRALTLAEEARDGLLTARALHTLGAIYERLEVFDQALAQLLQAAQLYTNLGHPQRRLRVLTSVGVVYSRSGQPEEGLRVYREALAASQGDEPEVVTGRHNLMNNIGINCKNLGRLDEAEAVLRTLLTELGDTAPAAMRASALHNLGEVCARQGRRTEAEAAQRGALGLGQACGWPTIQAEATLSLARLLLARGAPSEAGALLQAGADVFPAAPGERHAAWLALRAEVARAGGEWQSAYELLDQARQAERAAYSEIQDRRLKQLQVSFDLERARQAAEHEHARGVELQAALTALAEADAHKALLVQRLDRLSREDALTGLANRRHFNETLEAHFQAARATGTPLTVALLDLDDFKRVNDQRGHATGDAVLRRAAEVLRAHAAAGWTVARYGGEEFAVILPGLDAGRAAAPCEAIRAALAGADWATAGLPWTQTTSIGVADDPRAATPEALVARADDKLYEAKRAGKNRVAVVAG